MKITAIKQQVKQADRYSISVDGKYAFSLSESGLLNTGLRLNQEFTENELEELRTRAVIDKAFGWALNLISHRSRSEWEIREYLKRKEYEPDITEQAVGKLRERGYINDEDFARRWVESRRLLKATSKRRLSQELRQKRVSDEAIEKVLAADETDEAEVLKQLIERKRKQSRYQDDMKLMQYLNRQGFQYDNIKRAMSGSD